MSRSVSGNAAVMPGLARNRGRIGCCGFLPSGVGIQPLMDRGLRDEHILSGRCPKRGSRRGSWGVRPGMPAWVFPEPSSPDIGTPSGGCSPDRVDRKYGLPATRATPGSRRQPSTGHGSALPPCGSSPRRVHGPRMPEVRQKDRTDGYAGQVTDPPLSLTPCQGGFPGFIRPPHVGMD